MLGAKVNPWQTWRGVSNVLLFGHGFNEIRICGD
jgi:hypothetical protein